MTIKQLNNPVLADLQSVSIEYKHLKCETTVIAGLQIPILQTVGFLRSALADAQAAKPEVKSDLTKVKSDRTNCEIVKS